MSLITEARSRVKAWLEFLHIRQSRTNSVASEASNQEQILAATIQLVLLDHIESMSDSQMEETFGFPSEVFKRGLYAAWSLQYALHTS